MIRLQPALRTLTAVGTLCAAASAWSAERGGDILHRNDAAGDAAARRTDPGADGAINESSLVDLLSVTMSGWETPTPQTDPYKGQARREAHLLRIDLRFAGLVNPPGPLGLGFEPFDPFRFGDRAVFGFLEIDVDDRKDSGGELGDAATLRYLANVGRFGATPDGSIGERAARSADDYDGSFATGPQFERSGAEYIFGFCGCFDTALVSEAGNGDGVMDSGEVFVVRGRFFRRVDSLQSISGMEGGSAGGLYDPQVDVRFSHDATEDVTTVTIVYPLDMTGAAMLTGQPQQPANFFADDHTSVIEAILDLIDGADGYNGPITYPVSVLVNDWEGRSANDYLNPSDWRVTGLFGVSYLSPQPSLYVWTDVGFDERFSDFNSDSIVDAFDITEFDAFVAAADGGASDADGMVNGEVVIVNAGPNFSLFDLDGDGVVDGTDAGLIQLDLAADLNGDGAVNAADLAILLGAWGSSSMVADIDGDGTVNATDLAELLGAWSPTP